MSLPTSLKRVVSGFLGKVGTSQMAIFTILLVLLLTSHWSDYFLSPFAEYSDFAVYALQIEDAKSVRELYGHYSRWGFHHPGPAYFYLYALGEYIFLDWLNLVPAPHNAHLLTGLILQVGLFAATLSLISRVVTSKLFLPITILLASIHFSLADNAFFSIWPPHILLFPFLGFIVCCSLMAMGDVRLLPLLAFLGGLLVHNHVAQPLFVIPMFVWSYSSLLRRSRTESVSDRLASDSRAFARHHLIAAAIVLLFLLPIAIDVLDGSDSNLSQIVRHLRQTEEQRKTALQSILYFLSFLLYEGNPEVYVTKVGTASLELFSNRLWVIVTWSLIGIISVVYWASKPRVKRHRSEERLFVRNLLIALSIVISLAFAWGLLVTGSMSAPNGYFYYAITFLPLIFLAIILSRILDQSRLVAYASIPLTVLSLGVFYFAFAQQPMHSSAWNNEAFRQLMATELDTEKPVYLSFEHQDWPLAAGIAIELARNDVDFTVAPRWDFMFGDEHVLDSNEVAGIDFSIWRILPADKLPAGRYKISESRGILQVDKHLSALQPNDNVISFGEEGNFYYYEGIGWGGAERDFVWSAAPTTTLLFSPIESRIDVCLNIHGIPLHERLELTADFPKIQQVRIAYNDELLDVVTWEKEKSVTVTIPRQLWNQEAKGELEFTFPGALTPFDIEASIDRRTLAVAFVHLRTSFCGE